MPVDNTLKIDKYSIDMEKKKGDCCTLFSSVIGSCTMTMRADKRNVKRFPDGRFPLCLCFSIGGKRYYHSLGELYSDEELLRIRCSTGRGEKHGKIIYSQSF